MPPMENRATPPRYLLPSLFVSYVAVYFCRSDLTVISPIWDRSPADLGSLLSALSLDVCGVDGRQDLLPLFQGLQDGVGYFFASISGALVGNVVEAGGWAVGVGVLLGFHLFACVFTGLYAKGEGQVSTKSARRTSEFELVISDDVDEAFTIESDDKEDNALVSK